MRRIGCLIMLAVVCLLSGGCDRIAIERVYSAAALVLIPAALVGIAVIVTEWVAMFLFTPTKGDS